jgi:hypothetical protein
MIVGSPPLTGTATLVVNVISAKAILPSFMKPVQRLTVNEDAEPGQEEKKYCIMYLMEHAYDQS